MRACISVSARHSYMRIVFEASHEAMYESSIFASFNTTSTCLCTCTPALNHYAYIVACDGWLHACMHQPASHRERGSKIIRPAGGAATERYPANRHDGRDGVSCLACLRCHRTLPPASASGCMMRLGTRVVSRGF